MKVTLTNNFHNTSVTLTMASLFPSVFQVKRARKTLCGVTGCTCSDVMGMRGPQTVVVGERQEYIAGELIPSIRAA
jgi:hypothetical protein